MARALHCARAMASVLVVDDEPTLRRLLSRWLSDAGFDVTCAENGLVACRLLGDTAFDVILTDVRMPIMTGLELLAKARAAFPHIPVILISGSAEVGGKAEAVALGAFEFLAKPIKLAEIEKAVRTAAGTSPNDRCDAAPHPPAPRIALNQGAIEA